MAKPIIAGFVLFFTIALVLRAAEAVPAQGSTSPSVSPQIQSESGIAKTNPDSGVASAAIPAQTTQSSEQILRLQLYKESLEAQLETIKHANDQLLGTVHWTLGVVVTIAALLVGYNWFSTFKTFDREKATLKEEIMRTFQDRLAPFQNEFTKQVNETANKLEQRHVTFADDLSTKLNDSIRSMDKNFASFIAKTQSELATSRRELEEQIRSIVSTANSDVETRLKSLLSSSIETLQAEQNKKIKHLNEQFEALNTELHVLTTEVVWLGYLHHREKGEAREQAGKLGLAYTSYASALRFLANENYEWAQPAALFDLIRVLKAGAELTQHEKANLAELISGIHPSLKPQTEEFLSLATAAKEIKVPNEA
jgi:hypothetical protein